MGSQNQSLVVLWDSVEGIDLFLGNLGNEEWVKKWGCNEFNLLVGLPHGLDIGGD